jgi:glyoxylase-like metal-dependent hydrolase (beta-lactamase superfamily II)
VTERWSGGPVGERAVCVLAPNPGPMTLEGTNTWVLAEPGAQHAVVVDPGPDHPGHRAAVLDLLAARGQQAAVVLLTHGHPDHAEGARAFAEQARCRIRAVDPQHRWGPDGLEAGSTIEVAGLLVEVVRTPGHTADSACLLVPAEQALLTGDTLLGRGTTVVAHPDGRLADYLDSLQRLQRLAEQRGGLRLLPGHGPAGADVARLVQSYRLHRVERLDQVVAAVRAGASSVDAVVAEVYAEVPRELWPAATLSVLAQVDYLVARGALERGDEGLVSAPGA